MSKSRETAAAGTADGGPATAFQLKRGRLLQAAAACFNRKGYSGTSLRDVADKLDMTDAAIYHYVSGKQELVYECYLRAAEIGTAALARAVGEGGSGLEQARRYLRYHLQAMCGDEGPIAIMSEIPSLAPRHRDEILRRSRAHGRAFETLLEQGIGDGSIAPCDVRMTGNAIMGAVNWVPKWFHGDPAVAAQILAEFPAILTRGLAPRPRGLVSRSALRQSSGTMDENASPPVFMVVIGEITDREKMKAYSEALAESLLYEQHQGYYAAIGKPVEMLEEEWPSHQGLVLARFPSAEHARAFWNSDRYQNEIKPLRSGAGRFTVGLFEELPVPGHVDWAKVGF